MITTKTFLRKTKRGGIVKVVREHYLRDDISCGLEICKECCHVLQEQILDANPSDNLKEEITDPYYVMLDASVILRQMDVLEVDAIRNVIIPQTVLEEVQRRSSIIYKRLKDVIRNKDRKFHVFLNEHHKETYIERRPNEAVTDRNHRAVISTAIWYKQHLLLCQPVTKKRVKMDILILSENKDFYRLCSVAGVTFLSVKRYLELLNNNILLEKMAHYDDLTEEIPKEKELFPCHLPPTELYDLLRKKQVLKGTFYASRENFLEGSVVIEGQDESILVQGHAGLNRAVDGDIVAVQLLPEDQWSEPSKIVLEDDSPEDANDDQPQPEEELTEMTIFTKKTKSKVPTGRIVAIIQRKWRQYCGILQDSAQKNTTRHLFVPTDRKIPKIRIETRQAEFLKSQKIVVAIDNWPRTSKYPTGHFVKALGEIGDKKTENEVILLEHDVRYEYSDDGSSQKFSDQVTRCLPQLPWSITPQDEASREDLRHLDICSVDPPGCTDIDDALHCRLLENGNYEVGVHIADVSHFVKPGTALDEEAALRGTTVYLVGSRIDMLPELLSSNLCSLREGVDRFAFSCVWELNKNAEIVSTRFFKSIIRSKNSLTYEQAQLKIDDKKDTSTIAESLRNLNSIAKLLKRKRIENGALILASPEVRFSLDTETYEPLEVECKQLRETNSMVEEFMLLANMSVADKIYKEFPDCAILRRHPEPPQNNFEPLICAAERLNFKIDASSGKKLAESLDAAVKPENDYFNTMLRIIATRCMLQAVYFCTGMIPVSEFYHYGLAVPVYTHFTSPIRRYADLIVHRFLSASVGADSTCSALIEKKKMHDLCQKLNYRHRMAQYAGRASLTLYAHMFFRNKVENVEGYVLYVRKNALQILIPKYGIEGTLYLSNPFNKDQTAVFTYDEKEQSQTCGDVVFRCFDPVTVQISLDQNNIQHQKLVLKLIKPHVPTFSVSITSEEPMDVNIPSQEAKNGPEGNKNGEKAKKRKNKKQQKATKKTTL